MDHPNRNWFVGGASVLIALAIGLSTYDSIVAVKAERAEIEQEVFSATQAVANLDVARKRMADIQESLAQQPDALDEKAAKALREKVVRLIRATRCRLVKVQLGDPQTATWVPGTNPVAPPDVAQDDDETLRLSRTELNISAEGSLANVDQLIEKLLLLHPLAVPADVVVRKSGTDGTLQLEIGLVLLRLHDNEQNDD
ncbi:MAG: hypothetical protein Aurels2KO_37670 [Aureliella sp.]